MRNKIVKVFAPATIANLGAGFDVLGIALNTPGDMVFAKRLKQIEFNFSVKTNIPHLPNDTHNVAAKVALNMIAACKPNFGIHLELHKLMPLASGLGSSAASSVAAAVAVNALLTKPLKKMDLLPFVIEGERLASGAAHADNVAPSLLGGGCIIRNESRVDVIPFTLHPSWTWAIIRPHIMVKTIDARRLLPKTLPLSLAIRQLGNISGLMLGLQTGNKTWVTNCMVDHIAEPHRIKLIPGFNDIKRMALKQGALAVGISGSGPSIFALTQSRTLAKKIIKTMSATLMQRTGLTSDSYISQTNPIGAKAWQIK